jgi:cytochrome P450
LKISQASDSIALSVGSTLFFLALNPNCQQRAFEEIESILTEGKKEWSMEDLGRLKYLEMCWKEALRLHPPAPLLGRKLSEDIVLGQY